MNDRNLFAELKRRNVIRILDPRNTDLLSGAAGNYADPRQFDASRKLSDRALEILPNDPDLMAGKAATYQGEGNLPPAAKLLSNVKADNPSLVVFSIKIWQLKLERNFEEAVRLLQDRIAHYHFGSELEKGAFTTQLALMQYQAGERTGAAIAAEEARKILEPLCKNQPDNHFSSVCLSRAYALLGDKSSAVKEAERALTLRSTIHHAAVRPGMEENLAVIRTIVGENTDAISILTRLLKIPYLNFDAPTPITCALLRLDPAWDPLRSDAAFQKLCEEKPH